jgi:signal transduction histidine kinase
VRRGGIAAILATAAGFAWLAASGPRVTIVAHEFSPNVDVMAPVSLLGNAEDDFAALTGRALVIGRLMEGEARSIEQVNFHDDVRLAAVVDVDDDGRDEICCGTWDSVRHVAHAVLLDGGDTLVVVGPERDSASAKAPDHPTWLMPRAVLREEAQPPLLLCSVMSMFARPRGVVAYAIPGGERRWYRATGAWPAGILAADVNGDGDEEVVVSGSATQNGIADHGIDDGRSWVIVLDRSGQPLWQVPLGQGASHVYPLVLRGDARSGPRIVVAVYNHAGQNPPPSRLVVLEGRTGAILHERTLPQRISEPRLLDEAGGTFVIGSADGVVRSFDRDLTLLATRRLTAPSAAWGSADVLADGSKCVIASTDRDLYILDRQLRPIGHRRIRGEVARDPLELRLARAGLRDWRVCTTSGTGLVFDLEPVGPFADGPRVAGVVGVAALAGLVTTFWRRRPRRMPSITDAREFLVDYRRVRHDVFDDVRPFGRLWNWAQEAEAGAVPPAGVFEEAREQYLAFGEAVLRRFAERARGLHVDERVVDRIRDRLEALAVALRAGDAASEGAAPAGAVAAAMRELSDACAAAYREVALREPCRADEVAVAVFAAKRAGLLARGIASELRLDPSGAVPVLFAADDLGPIVGQLVDNAAAALAGRDAARLRLSVSQAPTDPRRVLLRVEDDGPGIPPEDRERVFRPDVSSRPEGGFGLAYARETSRSWCGDLVIEDTEWGSGAAVVMILARLLPFEDGA